MPAWDTDSDTATDIPAAPSDAVAAQTDATAPLSQRPSSWLPGSPVETNRVFSYVVRYDTGFAPNPFHGLLTLATCKPKIRQSASRNDILVGLSSRSERIVYAAQVDSIVGFEEFWADPQFVARQPRMDSARIVDRVGDNIYEPAAGSYRQLHSMHSNPDGSEDPGHKQRDAGTNRVLVSERFTYWGGSGPSLPEDLSFLAIGIGHRVNFTPEQIATVADWFAALPGGVQASPTHWKPGDLSWRES